MTDPIEHRPDGELSRKIDDFLDHPERTPQDVWPDAADPVDEALTALADPRQLLAEALTHIRSAQVISQTISSHPDPVGGDDFDTPRGGRHRRLLDEAFQLTRVAEVAAKLAEPTTVRALDDDTFDEGETSAEWTPRPAVGVTFVAAVDGVPLGAVGDGRWIWSELWGFIDVTYADTVEGLKSGGVRATFSGSLKTTTDSQALGVTGGGGTVLLPRRCVIESPDE